VRKFLGGIQWLSPLEPFYFSVYNGETNPFLSAWKNQTKEDLDRIRAANPMQPGEPGYQNAAGDFFQHCNPEFGSGFLYDAVIATGIGACLALQETGANITGEAHVWGIRSVNFEGASGTVRFRGDEGDECALEGQVRDPFTLHWSLFNFLPQNPASPLDDGSYQLRVTDAFIESENLTSFVDTVYADNTTIPPLLRDTPEQNYLEQGVRITGFAIMGCVLLMALVSASWVYCYRNDRVLRASQVPFLYLLCLGSALEAVAILPMSFDESYWWSESQLSKACMAIPWLFCLGYIVTYSALFGKVRLTMVVLECLLHPRQHIAYCFLSVFSCGESIVS